MREVWSQCVTGSTCERDLRWLCSFVPPLSKSSLGPAGFIGPQAPSFSPPPPLVTALCLQTHLRLRGRNTFDRLLFLLVSLFPFLFHVIFLQVIRWWLNPSPFIFHDLASFWILDISPSSEQFCLISLGRWAVSQSSPRFLAPGASLRVFGGSWPAALPPHFVYCFSFPKTDTFFKL